MAGGGENHYQDLTISCASLTPCARVRATRIQCFFALLHNGSILFDHLSPAHLDQTYCVVLTKQHLLSPCFEITHGASFWENVMRGLLPSYKNSYTIELHNSTQKANSLTPFYTTE